MGSDLRTPNSPPVAHTKTPLRCSPLFARRWLISGGLLGLTSGLVWYQFLALAETRGAQRQLQSATTNALLMTQQLDALFESWIEQIAAEPHLTAEQREVVETWINFDDQYVTQNEADATLLFERGTAHRRLGYCFYRTQRFEPATAHLRLAVALFETLVSREPDVPSYRSEVADTWAMLGWVLHSSSQPQAATAAYREAERIYSDAGFSGDPAIAGRLHDVRQQIQFLTNR